MNLKPRVAMRSLVRRPVTWICLVVGLGAFFWWSDPAHISASSQRLLALEDALETVEDRGIASFAFGDFGALSSDTLRRSAAPWKLLVAALALMEAGGDAGAVARVDHAALFRRYGFHVPLSLENWPAHLAQPELALPLGLNIGYGTHGIWPVAATIANTGCPACHASVVYRADGSPDTDRVWLGAPNTSINLEAYAMDVFAALRAYAGQTDRVMQAVTLLFPETGWQERLTLRFMLAPLVADEVAKRDALRGRLLPFSGGLPGATNGLNALQDRLGLLDTDVFTAKSAFSSVPELGGRVWRTGFLNTNAYAIPGQARRSEIIARDIDRDHLAALGAIIAYFTLPSMGVTPEIAEAHVEEMGEIAAWMHRYRPQPFPGEIARALLARGRTIYATRCSMCHGRYDDSLKKPRLVAFPNWLGDVGTDRAAIDLTTRGLADRVNESRFGRYIAARSAEGYIAPPLTGIWSSAPYLHNGSVPTLWHLMRPEARPERFVVGGHALDLSRVGIAGTDDGTGGWMPPEGYVPWSIPAIVDTSAYGSGNQGHEAEFDILTEADRVALLEYLKLL